MLLSFKSIREEKPGKKWGDLFKKTWPHYKTWFLSEGHRARPGYLTSSTELESQMPELMSVYEKIVDLAGGGDLEARFLSMYCPPPYMSGCSQVAWTKGNPSLIRNYDYSPRMFEGVMLYTNWLQPVIGMSDCAWGLLDGMNGSGLAVSLTFGGRKVMGEGFGIPLILRYVLETSASTAEAIKIFIRIPVHMSYNVTIIDRSSSFATIFLSPDRAPEVHSTPVATNHQGAIEWHDYAVATGTRERMEVLYQYLSDHRETDDTLFKKFLQPPLYNTYFEKSFGTLYTIKYQVNDQNISIMWPHKKIDQSFLGFEEKREAIMLQAPKRSKQGLI